MSIEITIKHKNSETGMTQSINVPKSKYGQKYNISLDFIVSRNTIDIDNNSVILDGIWVKKRWYHKLIDRIYLFFFKTKVSQA